MAIKNKKVFIILLIAAALVLMQEFDFDLLTKNKSAGGQMESTSQGEDNLKVIFFDVGQGDAIFIETPEKKQILIDGGDSSLILDKLTKQMKFDDRLIDVIVLTHPHADHVTGLVEVLKRYQVGEVWLTGVIHTSSIYLEFLNLIKEKQIPTKIIFACGKENIKGCHDIIALETGLQFKILYPLENLSQKRLDDANNSSIVMKLNYKTDSLMLVGDAGITDEEKMLGIFEASELKSDVLKLGHHGSADASSEKFLEAIQPEYGIISVGKDNPYGHPSLRIVRRLERIGAKIFRTDESGDIVFTGDNNGIKTVDN
ncbi:hypothetical protein COW86_03750 [Candidatus Kuenenbacteria bacterium CG22_combo_CG10-13_8_21_14_all_39_9]|uniref:Metallo-beta-lactamase domain-containing protein n=2 Tax=Candidatus Kueneniibacteriota TaxID=1752740 RepID=A0A2H0D1E7_9BACT|nr:MAG: hypothetical protein AUK13_00835 [Candidatus Kuenenbacteria bacterium CG2_30_39_24]PIP75440.1 MAG: hypothetical protein COW86_03750 [Candidatus Kuenenbacteria bacterium CG22_combo_CG10-13_8_21_14_all_39_9]